MILLARMLRDAQNSAAGSLNAAVIILLITTTGVQTSCD